MTNEELIKDIKSLCNFVWDEWPPDDYRFRFANKVMEKINKELEANSPQEGGSNP